MKKKTIIFTALGSVSLICLALVFVTLNKTAAAETIPANANLKQARELSKGTKDACLNDSKQAVAAVEKDDKVIQEDPKVSSLELALSGAIIDVPAGTNFENTVNAYDGKVVSGTLAYEGDYGTYNYSVKKLPKHGEWQFTSMVACKK